MNFSLGSAKKWKSVILSEYAWKEIKLLKSLLALLNLRPFGGESAVGRECAVTRKSFTTISILLRAISICSRKFQFAQGNFNLLMAISIYSRQFQFYSGQFQFVHGNFNFTHGNFNLFTAISICSRQFQHTHGNSIYSRQFQLVHGNFNLFTAISICSRQFNLLTGI